MTNITWSENLSEEGGEEDFPHIGQIRFSNGSDKNVKKKKCELKTKVNQKQMSTKNTQLNTI